ncbi:MAG TPA: guanylate kinase [Candidatus Alectryocaccobium stercorigallinarum]|nr:guanylate kinase [Candidatus Alectryocaccobium stercorigallinarum]
MGKIFMIIGKSASGKDHIYPKLLEDGSLKLKPLILYTTRPKRSGEENGREYYFTDIKHLEELRKAGKIIEERVYPTVHGDWYYFTADEGQIDTAENYITIGTLQSFMKMRQHFGKEVLVPLYIESDPYLRLQRSLGRERKQKAPEYKEVCRRFLADEEDFSEERLQEAGIDIKFLNNTELKDCVSSIKTFIKRKISQ